MPRTLSYVTKYGRSCDGCGAVLAATSRPYRRFCSGACRAAAHRREHDTRLVTPGELARLVRAVDPAVAEVSLVAGIALAARSDWRSAAWLLERRWPERWAHRLRRTGTSSSSSDAK